jgi:transcriptional regulator with XRE-family HTH domain
VSDAEPAPFYARVVRQYHSVHGRSPTQADLAELAGIHQTSVSDWKKGAVPRGEVVARLARALDVSADWLLEGYATAPLPERTHAEREPSSGAFYARLVEALRAAGRPSTQASIAELLGVGQSAVSHWATGKSYPSLDLIVRLARTARVSIDWLVTGRHGEAPPADAGAAELLRIHRQLPAERREWLMQAARLAAGTTRNER